jgi:hypothetical protein
MAHHFCGSGSGVEHRLAKAGVAGSNPVFRSKRKTFALQRRFFVLCTKKGLPTFLAIWRKPTGKGAIRRGTTGYFEKHAYYPAIVKNYTILGFFFVCGKIKPQNRVTWLWIGWGEIL